MQCSAYHWQPSGRITSTASQAGKPCRDETQLHSSPTSFTMKGISSVVVGLSRINRFLIALPCFYILETNAARKTETAQEEMVGVLRSGYIHRSCTFVSLPRGWWQCQCEYFSSVSSILMSCKMIKRYKTSLSLCSRTPLSFFLLAYVSEGKVRYNCS